MTHAASGVTVQPFVPCEDFALSGQFYLDLGFEKTFDDGRLAVFRAGSASFYLQKYQWPGMSEHFMLQLAVDDVDAWWAHVQASDLVGRYNIRVVPPKDEPWGARVFRLIDPAGVLWHVSQRPA